MRLQARHGRSRHRAQVLGALVLAPVLAMLLAGGAAGSSSTRQQSVTIERGIQYADPEGVPLLLDAYRPSGGGLHPGVIVIHGGGWRYNDRSEFAGEATYLAEQGFVAFSVDYRLAPRYPFPAAVEDVQSAVVWVRAHAAQFGVDPTQLGALGGSAGGHLAGMLAVLGSGSTDTGSRIRVAVSWSGPMDLNEVLRDGHTQEREIVREFLNCPTGSCEQVATEASPVTYVDASDGALFVANGSNEKIPWPQAAEMDQALRSAGVPDQLVQVPGTMHSRSYENVSVTSNGRRETVLQASVDFLNQWIGHPRTGGGGGSGAGGGSGSGASPGGAPSGPSLIPTAPKGNAGGSGPTDPPTAGATFPPQAAPASGPADHPAALILLGGLILVGGLAAIKLVGRLLR